MDICDGSFCLSELEFGIFRLGTGKKNLGQYQLDDFDKFLLGAKGGFSWSNDPRGMKGKGSDIEEPRAIHHNYPYCLLHNQRNSVIHEGKTFHCVFFFSFGN